MYVTALRACPVVIQVCTGASCVCDCPACLLCCHSSVSVAARLVQETVHAVYELDEESMLQGATVGRLQQREGQSIVSV